MGYEEEDELHYILLFDPPPSLELFNLFFFSWMSSVNTTSISFNPLTLFALFPTVILLDSDQFILFSLQPHKQLRAKFIFLRKNKQLTFP